MVHERLGIKNNRIDLSKVPGISKELKVILQEVTTLIPRVSNADYADACTRAWERIYRTRVAERECI